MEKTKTTIPQLNSGIEFNKLNKNEYILCNATNRHYLKINKETHNLLNIVDGVKNIEDICKVYNDQFSKKISEQQLEDLLYKKLKKFGILKGFEKEIEPYKKPNYLKLSFIILNEKKLSKIVKIFYFLFFKKVAITSIILSITIITYLLFTNLELYRSFNLQESLVYFVSIMGLSAMFHEIGHATATNYFGAKHGGIGGGFYLFSPVAFADVTDIWRLKKSQRIVVSLSGVYFEMLFCSLLASLGFFIENNTLMIIAISIGLFSFNNLTPFLRNDGYWILSDLIEKPNLFHHSTEKIKEVLQFFMGKKNNWTAVDVFLLLYGIVSYFLITTFIYYILIVNPNSILLFPKNLVNFIKSIFDSNAEFSLIKYGELIVPLLFFTLVFGMLKNMLLKKNEK